MRDYEYLLFEHDGGDVIHPLGSVKTLKQAMHYIEYFNRHNYKIKWITDVRGHHRLLTKHLKDTPFFETAESDYMRIPVTKSKILAQWNDYVNLGWD